MNAIANVHFADADLGWAPNLERLRANLETAGRSGRPDRWATVEAECWLELIDAELTAESTLADPVLCQQLHRWREEIIALLGDRVAAGTDDARYPGAPTGASGTKVAH